MSALLIPFPAVCVVRTASEQRRIAERFAVELGKGRRKVSADVAWKRAVLSPVKAEMPLSDYEIQFEKLAQMIADRARPGARKATPSPPTSDLEREMDPLAERIAARAKEILAERSQAIE